MRGRGGGRGERFVGSGGGVRRRGSLLQLRVDAAARHLMVMVLLVVVVRLIRGQLAGL